MEIASAFTDAKILVTGAAGFIGGHLAAQLARVRCDLVLVDRVDPARPFADAAARVAPRILDAGSPAFRELVLAGGFDHIFHFAGNANVAVSVARPDEDFAQNCAATFHLLDALRRAGSKALLVYASSAAVYGNPVRLPMGEGDPTVPISPYGVSKLAAERYLKVYCDLYGLGGVSLRMFSPFGPGLRKQIVFDLARKVLGGARELQVLGDGRQERDFLYVDDLVSGILHVAARGTRNGEVYNIGRGASTSTGEIAREIVRILGRDIAVVYDRLPVAGNPDVWRADVGRLEALGWRASVPLAEGLERTANWIAREYPQH